MFARRKKLLLKESEEDKKEEEIEEVTLNDDDIEEIFEVRDLKGKTHNKLGFYPEIETPKRKGRKKKENKQDNLNGKRLKTDESSDDDLECLDSDADDSVMESLLNPPKSANKKLPTYYDQTNSSTTVNDDDAILICSVSSSPVQATTTTTSTADDSFEPAFDPNLLPPDFKFVRTTRIKFKYKGTYHCVTFKSTDKFKDKLTEISETLSLDTAKMILMFDNETISFEESPESLNIGICDIIDVFEKKQDENLVEEKEDPNMFKIKFRDCESRKRNQDVMLSMIRYDTFESIFKKYAQLKGLPLERIIFEFDGERMESDQKPDDLDMENESLVDVKVKKA